MIEEEEVKWLKHYASVHQILLVGDGDFSFSLSLANAFGSASNIVATSLDPYDDVIKNYSGAKSNLENLVKLCATVIHGVDATKMKLHTDLAMRKFDRIVFNFPHAGFHGKEDQIHLIKLHQNLVRGFFKNASQMLRPYGEIHVSHKTSEPYDRWDIKELASKCSLTLAECVKFEKEDYPGYDNKRGDGSRCDKPFRLGECSTFKFQLNTRKDKTSVPKTNYACGRSLLNITETTQHIRPTWETPEGIQFHNARNFDGNDRPIWYPPIWYPLTYNTTSWQDILGINPHRSTGIFSINDHLHGVGYRQTYHTRDLPEIPGTQLGNLRHPEGDDCSSSIISHQGLNATLPVSRGHFKHADVTYTRRDYLKNLVDRFEYNHQIFGRADYEF